MTITHFTVMRFILGYILATCLLILEVLFFKYQYGLTLIAYDIFTYYLLGAQYVIVTYVLHKLEF